MSQGKQKLGNFGEVARFVTNLPVDWERLFRDEHQRRASAEGRVSELEDKLAGLSGDQQKLLTAHVRLKGINGRLDDMRRGIAARLMAALIIKEGLGQGPELTEQACRIVDATDELVSTLMATRRPE